MMLLTGLGAWIAVSLLSALVWVALVAASRRTGPRLTAESVRRQAAHDLAVHPRVVPLGSTSADHAA